MPASTWNEGFELLDRSYFPKTLIIKRNANNGRIQNSCPFPTPMAPSPGILFIIEEAASCINDEAIGAINEAVKSVIIVPRNLRSCFFSSCFTVSVAPSINKPDFYSGSTVIIKSSTS